MTSWKDKRLYKISEQGKIAGVCAGLSEYFELDVTLIRLAMVASIFIGGAGIVFYIIAALVMPDKKDLA
ncbi:MAG: PspC domain-containing protein [Candidatus Saccharibacteria bacterium]|nr:PspC domain-containing protein [Candidatus Saccharibacteria bacterium]